MICFLQCTQYRKVFSLVKFQYSIFSLLLVLAPNTEKCISSSTQSLVYYWFQYPIQKSVQFSIVPVLNLQFSISSSTQYRKVYQFEHSIFSLLLVLVPNTEKCLVQYSSSTQSLVQYQFQYSIQKSAQFSIGSSTQSLVQFQFQYGRFDTICIIYNYIIYTCI